MSKKKIIKFIKFPYLSNTYYTCGECMKRISLYSIVAHDYKNCPRCDNILKQHGIAKLQDHMHEQRRRIITERTLKRKDQNQIFVKDIDEKMT